MIPLAVPNLGPREQEYTAQAIANGYIGPSGPFVEKFEAMVAKASGRKWAVAVLTGTAALEVSARVLGFLEKHVVVNNDEFPAMKNILTRLGCGIEFNDRFNDVPEWHDATFYKYQDNWPEIADRAPAIGESSMESLVECYSFAANKIATCGHGGAVVGDDFELEVAVRDLIQQGYGRHGIYNFRMADINAAIGCAQMERLDELKAAKKRIWNRYAEHLTMINRGPSRWMATADLPHSFADQLATQGIECRKEPSGGISLPCSTGLTVQDQDHVMSSCISLLKTAQTEAP